MAAEEKSEAGSPGRRAGRVKKVFDRDKMENGGGYSFVVPDGGGEDVFVSFSDVINRQQLPLVEGDRVQYDVVENTKGKGFKGVNIVIDRTAPPADTDTPALEAPGVPINELTKSVYKLCRAQPPLSNEVIAPACKH